MKTSPSSSSKIVITFKHAAYGETESVWVSKSSSVIASPKKLTSKWVKWKASKRFAEFDLFADYVGAFLDSLGLKWGFFAAPESVLAF